MPSRRGNNRRFSAHKWGPTGGRRRGRSTGIFGLMFNRAREWRASGDRRAAKWFSKWSDPLRGLPEEEEQYGPPPLSPRERLLRDKAGEPLLIQPVVGDPVLGYKSDTLRFRGREGATSRSRASRAELARPSTSIDPGGEYPSPRDFSRFISRDPTRPRNADPVLGAEQRIIPIAPPPERPRVREITREQRVGQYEAMKQWFPLTEKIANEEGVDVNLLRTLVMGESSGRADAVSRDRPTEGNPQGRIIARGLTQLTEGTAGDMGLPLRDIFDPEKNLRAGARYLKEKLDEFDGNANLALAAYYAGSGSIDKDPESKNYWEVPRIARKHVRRLGEILSIGFDQPEELSRDERIERISASGPLTKGLSEYDLAVEYRQEVDEHDLALQREQALRDERYQQAARFPRTTLSDSQVGQEAAIEKSALGVESQRLKKERVLWDYKNADDKLRAQMREIYPGRTEEFDRISDNRFGDTPIAGAIERNIRHGGPSFEIDRIDRRLREINQQRREFVLPAMREHEIRRLGIPDSSQYMTEGQLLRQIYEKQFQKEQQELQHWFDTGETELAQSQATKYEKEWQQKIREADVRFWEPGDPRNMSDEEQSWVQRIWGDTPLLLLKMAVGTPELLYGFADVPAGGRIGKALESVGFRPDRVNAMLSDFYTNAQKRANLNVAEAKTFTETLEALWMNKSVPIHMAVESAPFLLGMRGMTAVSQKIASGLLPKAFGKIAPKLVHGVQRFVNNPMKMAWATEGAMMAGASASEMRRKSETGLLTGEQQLIATGVGVVGGGFARAGAAIAKRMGIVDIDQIFVGGSTAQLTKRGNQWLTNTLKSALQEGLFEEAGQSVLEEIALNFDEGKTGLALLDGTPKAGVLGAAAGAITGGAITGVSGFRTAMTPGSEGELNLRQQLVQWREPNIRKSAADAGWSDSRIDKTIEDAKTGNRTAFGELQKLDPGLVGQTKPESVPWDQYVGYQMTVAGEQPVSGGEGSEFVLKDENVESLLEHEERSKGTLDELLKNLELSREGELSNEVKAKRIIAASEIHRKYQGLTVKEAVDEQTAKTLKGELASLGLSTTGNKRALAERLIGRDGWMHKRQENQVEEAKGVHEAAVEKAIETNPGSVSRAVLSPYRSREWAKEEWAKREAERKKEEAKVVQKEPVVEPEVKPVVEPPVTPDESDSDKLDQQVSLVRDKVQQLEDRLKVAEQSGLDETSVQALRGNLEDAKRGLEQAESITRKWKLDEEKGLHTHADGRPAPSSVDWNRIEQIRVKIEKQDKKVVQPADTPTPSVSDFDVTTKSEQEAQLKPTWTKVKTGEKGFLYTQDLNDADKTKLVVRKDGRKWVTERKQGNKVIERFGPFKTLREAQAVEVGRDTSRDVAPPDADAVAALKESLKGKPKQERVYDPSITSGKSFSDGIKRRIKKLTPRFFKSKKWKESTIGGLSDDFDRADAALARQFPVFINVMNRIGHRHVQNLKEQLAQGLIPDDRKAAVEEEIERGSTLRGFMQHVGMIFEGGLNNRESLKGVLLRSPDAISILTTRGIGVEEFLDVVGGWATIRGGVDARINAIPEWFGRLETPTAKEEGFADGVGRSDVATNKIIKKFAGTVAFAGQSIGDVALSALAVMRSDIGKRKSGEKFKTKFDLKPSEYSGTYDTAKTDLRGGLAKIKRLKKSVALLLVKEVKADPKNKKALKKIRDEIKNKKGEIDQLSRGRAKVLLARLKLLVHWRRISDMPARLAAQNAKTGEIDIQAFGKHLKAWGRDLGLKKITSDGVTTESAAMAIESEINEGVDAVAQWKGMTNIALMGSLTQMDGGAFQDAILNQEAIEKMVKSYANEFVDGYLRQLQAMRDYVITAEKMPAGERGQLRSQIDALTGSDAETAINAMMEIDPAYGMTRGDIAEAEIGLAGGVFVPVDVWQEYFKDIGGTWDGKGNENRTARYLEAIDHLINTTDELQRRAVHSVLRPMMALDMRIDWSDISIDFKLSVDDITAELPKRSNVGGQYDHVTRHMVLSLSHVGRHTPSHEFGHALSTKWLTELTGDMYDDLRGEGVINVVQRILSEQVPASLLDPTLTPSLSAVFPLASKERLEFVEGLVALISEAGLGALSENAYMANPEEIFARFVSKYVQWVEDKALKLDEDVSRLSFEEQQARVHDVALDSYELFDEKYFKAFSRLLQAKQMLDLGDGNPYGSEYSLYADPFNHNEWKERLPNGVLQAAAKVGVQILDSGFTKKDDFEREFMRSMRDGVKSGDYQYSEYKADYDKLRAIWTAIERNTSEYIALEIVSLSPEELRNLSDDELVDAMLYSRILNESSDGGRDDIVGRVRASTPGYTRSDLIKRLNEAVNWVARRLPEYPTEVNTEILKRKKDEATTLMKDLETHLNEMASRGTLDSSAMSKVEQQSGFNPANLIGRLEGYLGEITDVRKKGHSAGLVFAKGLNRFGIETMGFNPDALEEAGLSLETLLLNTDSLVDEYKRLGKKKNRTDRENLRIKRLEEVIVKTPRPQRDMKGLEINRIASVLQYHIPAIRESAEKVFANIRGKDTDLIRRLAPYRMFKDQSGKESLVLSVQIPGGIEEVDAQIELQALKVDEPESARPFIARLKEVEEIPLSIAHAVIGTEAMRREIDRKGSPYYGRKLRGKPKKALPLVTDELLAQHKAGKITADEMVRNHVIEAMKSNLILLAETYPELLREIAGEWYRGANKLAKELAKEFKLSAPQAAGVIAALSPQADWQQNIAMARRLVSIYRGIQEGRYPDRFDDDLLNEYLRLEIAGSEKAVGITDPKKLLAKANEDAKSKDPAIAQKAKESIPRIEATIDAWVEGKKLDLEQDVLWMSGRTSTATIDKGGDGRKVSIDVKVDPPPVEVDMRQQPLLWSEMNVMQRGQLIRTIEESQYEEEGAPARSRKYRLYAPDGSDTGQFAEKEKGVGFSALTWQGFDTIAKAISIIEDGSPSNINDMVGDGAKVRSFFNNINAPEYEGSVTIDTHAVAAAFLQAYGSSEKIVTDVMGGVSDLRTGLTLNAVIAEAYFQAAEALGIAPRVLQSITWEASRGLFPRELKTKRVLETRKQWEAYQKHGDLNRVQQEVLADSARINHGDTSGKTTAHGSYRDPAWADEAFRNTPDESGVPVSMESEQPTPVSARRRIADDSPLITGRRPATELGRVLSDDERNVDTNARGTKSYPTPSKLRQTITARRRKSVLELFNALGGSAEISPLNPPAFYSQLALTINAKAGNQKRIAPKDLLAWVVKKNPRTGNFDPQNGVKLDELQFLGFEHWVENVAERDKKGNVSIDDALDFIKHNYVRVIEVHTGDETADPSFQTEPFLDTLNLGSEGNTESYVKGPEGYVLPAGDNYRQVLLVIAPREYAQRVMTHPTGEMAEQAQKAQHKYAKFFGRIESEVFEEGPWSDIAGINEVRKMVNEGIPFAHVRMHDRDIPDYSEKERVGSYRAYREALYRAGWTSRNESEFQFYLDRIIADLELDNTPSLDDIKRVLYSRWNPADQWPVSGAGGSLSAHKVGEGFRFLRPQDQEHEDKATGGGMGQTAAQSLKPYGDDQVAHVNDSLRLVADQLAQQTREILYEGLGLSGQQDPEARENVYNSVLSVLRQTDNGFGFNLFTTVRDGSPLPLQDAVNSGDLTMRQASIIFNDIVRRTRPEWSVDFDLLPMSRSNTHSPAHQTHRQNATSLLRDMHFPEGVEPEAVSSRQLFIDEIQSDLLAPQRKRMQAVAESYASLVRELNMLRGVKHTKRGPVRVKDTRGELKARTEVWRDPRVSFSEAEEGARTIWEYEGSERERWVKENLTLDEDGRMSPAAIEQLDMRIRETLEQDINQFPLPDAVKRVIEENVSEGRSDVAGLDVSTVGSANYVLLPQETFDATNDLSVLSDDDLKELREEYTKQYRRLQYFEFLSYTSGEGTTDRMWDSSEGGHRKRQRRARRGSRSKERLYGVPTPATAEEIKFAVDNVIQRIRYIKSRHPRDWRKLRHIRPQDTQSLRRVDRYAAKNVGLNSSESSILESVLARKAGVQYPEGAFFSREWADSDQEMRIQLQLRGIQTPGIDGGAEYEAMRAEGERIRGVGVDHRSVNRFYTEARNLIGERHAISPSDFSNRSGAKEAKPSFGMHRSWHLNAFKRVLRLAVQGGYDSIGWAGGETQYARYYGEAELDTTGPEISPITHIWWETLEPSRVGIENRRGEAMNTSPYMSARKRVTFEFKTPDKPQYEKVIARVILHENGAMTDLTVEAVRDNTKFKLLKAEAGKAGPLVGDRILWEESQNEQDIFTQELLRRVGWNATEDAPVGGPQGYELIWRTDHDGMLDNEMDELQSQVTQFLEGRQLGDLLSNAIIPTDNRREVGEKMGIARRIENEMLTKDSGSFKSPALRRLNPTIGYDRNAFNAFYGHKFKVDVEQYTKQWGVGRVQPQSADQLGVPSRGMSGGPLSMSARIGSRERVGFSLSINDRMRSGVNNGQPFYEKRTITMEQVRWYAKKKGFSVKEVVEAFEAEGAVIIGREDASKDDEMPGGVPPIPNVSETPDPTQQSGDEVLPVDQIIEDLRVQMGNIPIEVGGTGGARGKYKRQAKVIFVKVRNELDVFAHEIGHHIHDSLFPDLESEELIELGRVTSAPNASRAQLLREGQAQFFKFWAHDTHHAKIIAPIYWEKFERAVDSQPQGKALREFQKRYTDYFNQAPEEAAKANVEFGPDLLTETDAVLRWEIALFNEYAPIKRAVRDMERLRKGKTGAVSSLSEVLGEEDMLENVLDDAFKLAELSRGSTIKARGFINNGVKGRDGEPMVVTDEEGNVVEGAFHGSLPEAWEPVMREAKKLGVKPIQYLETFATYLVMRHVPESIARGQQVGDITVTQAKAYTERHETEAFKEAAQNIYDYLSALLDYGQAEGVLDQDTMNRVRSAYQFYVPLHRVEVSANAASTSGLLKRFGSRFALQGRKKQGSTRRVINPLESIIKNTFVWTQRVEANKSLMALADQADSIHAEGLEGTARWIYKIPEKVRPITIKHDGEKLKKELIDLGAVLPEDADFEQLLTIFRPVENDPAQTIRILRNGKSELYRVPHQELYEAVTKVGKIDEDLFNIVFTKPAQLLRTSATTALEFLLRNPMKDTLVATVSSTAGFIPVYSTIRGLFGIIGGTSFGKKAMAASGVENTDQWYMNFINAGAGGHTLGSIDRNTIREEMRRLGVMKMRRRAMTAGGSGGYLGRMRETLFHVPRTGVEVIKGVQEAMENSSRVGEFIKVVERAERDGVGREEALARGAYSAAQITVNFKRAGTHARWFNKIKAFFNAAVQGNLRIAEVFYRNPVRATLLALTTITTPTIALWLMNRDDPEFHELPDWQRDAFWFIPLGRERGHEWLMLPKPFELGHFFGNTVEAALDYIYQQQDGPEAIRQVFGDPASWGSTAINTLLPTSIIPMVEVYANYSFFRRGPIVNSRQWGRIEPQFQANRYTSDTAKKLAGWLGSRTIGAAHFDHFLRGYTAGIGGYITDTIDAAVIRPLGGSMDPERPKQGSWYTRAWGLRGITKSTAATGQALSVAKFYEFGEDLEIAEQTIDEHFSRRDMSAWRESREKYREELRGAPMWNASREMISFYMGRIDREILFGRGTPEERGERIDRLWERIVDQARRFNRKPRIY